MQLIGSTPHKQGKCGARHINTVGQKSMPAISYQQIDTIFLPWAKARGLNVYTECKESEIRTTKIYDAQMNEYDLGVSP